MGYKAAIAYGYVAGACIINILEVIHNGPSPDTFQRYVEAGFGLAAPLYVSLTAIELLRGFKEDLLKALERT